MRKWSVYAIAAVAFTMFCTPTTAWAANGICFGFGGNENDCSFGGYGAGDCKMTDCRDVNSCAANDRIWRDFSFGCSQPWGNAWVCNIWGNGDVSCEIPECDYLTGIVFPNFVPGNPNMDVLQPEEPERPDQPEQSEKPNQSEKPGQPDTPEETGNMDSFALEVVELVNAEREKAGLSPLRIDLQTAEAAAIRADEIQRSFSHTRPDGSSFSTVLSETGVSYRKSGENIAYGQRTPQLVMNEWMNSAGHRANIFDSGFTAIGVGHVRSASGVDYWTQIFTN